MAGVNRLGHVPELDGLRACAVLIVMGYHAGLPGFSGGQVGVDVFFVLSGFLITVLLLEERADTGAIRLGAFYMRRVIRLYPALLVACLVALTLTALRVPVFGAPSGLVRDHIDYLPYVLLYTANIPRALDWSAGGMLEHTWSLSIEEQFYLVWPMLVVLVVTTTPRVRTLGWVAVALAMGSALTRTAMSIGGTSDEWLYNMTFTHVDGIFLGCALAAAWHVGGAVPRFAASRSAALVGAASILTVVALGRAIVPVGLTVAGLATGAILLHLLSGASWAGSRLLATRPLVEIGRRSYGLYLYHWPVFLFIGIDLRPHVLALGFGVSFAMAWVSFRWIEQPIMQLKRRWTVRTIAPSPVEDPEATMTTPHRRPFDP